MQRDSIDFGSMKVGQLFCKQLFPTLLGMVFSALFVITDGVFVGRGIGSDALAAVNIAAPLFVFAAGMGLMFMPLLPCFRRHSVYLLSSPALTGLK